MYILFFFFFSSRRRHTRCYRDWSSDVCSSDLRKPGIRQLPATGLGWRPLGHSRNATRALRSRGLLRGYSTGGGAWLDPGEYGRPTRASVTGNGLVRRSSDHVAFRPEGRGRGGQQSVRRIPTELRTESSPQVARSHPEKEGAHRTATRFAGAKAR